MLRTRTIVGFLAAFVFALPAARAVITDFNLLGKAGAGMIPGNENGTILGTPGSGGEVGAGIFFNDSGNQLTVNVGWGSGQGFTNLNTNATGFHIHGITVSPAPTSFTQNAGIMIGLDSLPGYNSSGTNGGFSGTVALTPTQVSALFNGQLYLNVHTTTNSGGEARGNLVPIPEPISLGAFAPLAMLMFRRRGR